MYTYKIVHCTFIHNEKFSLYKKCSSYVNFFFHRTLKKVHCMYIGKGSAYIKNLRCGFGFLDLRCGLLFLECKRDKTYNFLSVCITNIFVQIKKRYYWHPPGQIDDPDIKAKALLSGRCIKIKPTSNSWTWVLTSYLPVFAKLSTVEYCCHFWFLASNVILHRDS